MMKILGATLILAACLMAGAARARGMGRRIRLLRQLTAALEQMKGELEARAAPLPELAKLLSDRTEGPAGAFFTRLAGSMDRLGQESFSRLWTQAAEAELDALSLEELESFSSLGQLLGRCELETQLNALRTCAGLLGTSLENAEARFPDEKKVSLGLPAAAGLLLVIALF